MYKLEHPEYFWFLLLIPAMVGILLIYRWWQLRAQKQFGAKLMLSQMAPGVNKTRPFLKSILLVLAVAMLSLSLMNPKVGTQMKTVKRQGIDLVFALDVSKSMLAEDVNPNRLEKAKYLASNIIDELKGDRIGIVIYAGSAYPLLPITTDYATAKLKLSLASPNLVPSMGTALSDALKFSQQFYDNKDQKNRLLVILSDGEDHEEGWEQEAGRLKEMGIQLITIGLGTEKGAPIPIKNSRGQITDYKKDYNGEVVVTKKNEAILRNMAKKTGGQYFDGHHATSVIEGVLEHIENMEKTEFEAVQVSDYQDQFQWFLGAAILLLFAEIFIGNKKRFWMEKIGLVK